MFFFRRKKKEEQAGQTLRPSAAISRNLTGDAKFWQLYAESLQLKERGALASAAGKRETAYFLFRGDSGYRGMACHNLAILCMHHLGDGQAAARFARESLSCGDDFYRFSEAHREEIAFGAHLESLQTAAHTAASYDEALDYIGQGASLYGGVFNEMRDEMQRYRREHPRYADYQRGMSLTFYSRVSPQADKGNYAPAMSLLQLLLDHAEDPGYDLSYEEYVDLLDDYNTIAIMYLLKKAEALRGTEGDFARELAFLADAPLARLSAFLPDCQPSDRKTFENIIEGWRRLPGVAGREAFAPFR